jgi:alkylation response protein AidB-like acyl-CoA dehydrogenase
VDLDFSKEQWNFREEVRTWLAEHKPARPRPSDAAGIRRHDTGWQRTQYEGGWAGISWPKEYGGRGLSLLEQLIWYEEYARAGVPSMEARSSGSITPARR